MTDEQLKWCAVALSDLSLLGLVGRLADVERGWFRQCAAREDVPDLYYTKTNPQADFDDIEIADADAERLSARVEAARNAVAGLALDVIVPFLWADPIVILDGCITSSRRY